MSRMSSRIIADYGELYPYKNDPRHPKKNVFVSNVNTYSGQYMPILEDRNYGQRRSRMHNSYEYDDKVDRGARPMHQSTFKLNYQTNTNPFITNNMLTFRGNQLKPENVPQPSKDQFRHHFDLGFNNKRRFQTDYDSNFYPKYSQRSGRHQIDRSVAESDIIDLESNKRLDLDRNELLFRTQHRRPSQDLFEQPRDQSQPKDYGGQQRFNF